MKQEGDGEKMHKDKKLQEIREGMELEKELGWARHNGRQCSQGEMVQ